MFLLKENHILLTDFTAKSNGESNGIVAALLLK